MKTSFLSLCLSAFLFVFQTPLSAQTSADRSSAADSLLNSWELSLLTCSPGAETAAESYTAWGHTALRLRNTLSQEDVVFNYGMFDFNTPNFYWRFVRGGLQYFLGIQNADPFFRIYTRENRQITEQHLSLSQEQKQAIIQLLKTRYEPQNRYYTYGFSDRNCTSEVRDLLYKNLPLNFQDSLLSFSCRHFFNAYLQNRLWLRLGVSLILGPSVDKPATLYESLFLPDALCENVRLLKIEDRPLVSKEEIHNPLPEKNTQFPFWKSPLFIFCIFAALALALSRRKGIRFAVYLIFALGGLLISGVCIISLHQELLNNVNLLWINPLYLLVILLLWCRKPILRRIIIMCIWGCTAIAVLLFALGIQFFEWSFLPLMVAGCGLLYRDFINKDKAFPTHA